MRGACFLEAGRHGPCLPKVLIGLPSLPYTMTLAAKLLQDAISRQGMVSGRPHAHIRRLDICLV